MERDKQLADVPEPRCCPHGVEYWTYERPRVMDSVLTDAALIELKKQSARGCLLCSLEALDEEEWD